jgi:MipA family protein
VKFATSALAAAAFGLSTLGLGVAANAADQILEEGIDTSTTDLSVRVGIGGLFQPDYTGSNDYEVVPWPIVSLEYLRLPGLGDFGGRTVGFTIGPSFGFVGERDQTSNAALNGLGDVDAAFEAGIKAAYEVNYWGAYAAVRRGFGGYDGFVGEAALYAVWRPTDVWVVRAGPNVSFADSDYFNTYYSVTPGQSAASGLAAYNAGSGFKTVGLQANAVYSWTEKVDLHFRAGYERLVGGAADSPIVTTAGSENQFTAGIGISYRLDLDLFD